MGLFGLLWSVFETLQMVLSKMWYNFFYNTRWLYSSDAITLATPFLILALVLFRVFGPADQGSGIGKRGIAENMDRAELVNERTYAGGGNFSGPPMRRPAAPERDDSGERKKDR